MPRRAFYVRAHWDDEAEVFYSESDIEGLHIEAATIEEFVEVMNAIAGDLIVANHIPPEEFGERPFKDLLPNIFWETPPKAAIA